MKVYNMLGEQVLGSRISGQQSEFNLSGSPNGVYIIKVKTESGEVMKKIVKD